MTMLAKWIGAVTLAGLLVGCGGTPTVYDSRIYHDSWPDFFNGGTQSEYLAVVWGNPFDAAQERTDAVVLKSVDQAFNRSGSTFSTNPSDVDPLVPYVAVVFNAEAKSSGLPCSDLTALQPSRADRGNVRVHAALCRAGSPLTGARGHVADVTGPDDPRFKDLMYQVAVELFRNQRGTDGRDRNLRL